MSDFLTICQEVRTKSGISGTGPTTVVSQTGILGRLVDAVRDAWLRIQTDEKDWKWMWVDAYGLSVLSATTDFPLTGVEKIHTKTFMIYETSLGLSDRTKISYVDWDRYQASFGQLQTIPTERPSVVTQKPNGDLHFYPTPVLNYTCDFEYQKEPQLLSGNTDVPELPARFHPLIVWEALNEFGGLEDAPEVIDTSKGIGGVMWNQLLWDQVLKRAEHMTVISE
jgi:hypothetical protein